MTAAHRPPGDPSHLHLRISHTDALLDTPHADALERWDVDILLGRGPTTPERIGSMRYFRVHVDRGQNAFWAMESETEELYEIARAVLDPATGNFNDAASQMLDYVGSGLLVMDRVTLSKEWRGHGLGAILALEVILRLMPGCRAIACSPGVTDLTGERLRDRAEFDRVTSSITRSWERIGFRRFEDAVYLLSPVAEELEKQRDAGRARLAALGAAWRRAASAEPA